MCKPNHLQHIRTRSNIKSFRSCRSHTGAPMQLVELRNRQREEFKLALRLWHHSRDVHRAADCYYCWLADRTRVR